MPMPRSGVPLIGLGQLFAAVILLSSAWPLAKIAVNAGTTPLWFGEGRAVLSVVTASTLLAVRRGFAWPARADLPVLLAVGGLQIGAFFAFTHEAVSWVQAGRTAILANTTTIWVVPLSLVFLHERIPLTRWLAAALGVVGIIVMINPLSIDWTQRDVLIGHGFLLAASFSWAVAIIVTRARPPAHSMFVLLPWCFLISALVLLPLVLWDAPNGTLGHDANSFAPLLYVGLIAGPLGTWCIMEATVRLPAVVSSVGFLTTPAVGLILANLMLHEPFTPDLLLGSGLIMSGVAFAAFPARGRPEGRPIRHPRARS